MRCRRGSVKLPVTSTAFAPATSSSCPSQVTALRAFAAGIWRDYEHQNGAVVIDSADYVSDVGRHRRQYREALVAARRRLGDARECHSRPAAGDRSTTCARRAELRRLSLQAFDRTFAITYLLELVAVLIGLFGIAAGISAQVLARRGEFGVLRHLGFTRAQIATMLAIEGAVLGAIGVVVGLLTGARREPDSHLRREPTVVSLEHGPGRARRVADCVQRRAGRGGRRGSRSSAAGRQ